MVRPSLSLSLRYTDDTHDFWYMYDCSTKQNFFHQNFKGIFADLQSSSCFYFGVGKFWRILFKSSFETLVLYIVKGLNNSY